MPAIFGVIILTMISAVLYPIASCKTSESWCIYDDTPKPPRLPLEAFEEACRDWHDKGKIGLSHMR